MNEIEKIQEAEYFYAQMDREREVREHLKFNLSAFLSAARSVLQYALEEAQKHRRGQVWYELQMKSSPVLRFFKDKRDANVHVEPLVVRADIGIHAREQLGVRLSESVSIAMFEEGRQVGRYDSRPAEPGPESEAIDQSATITTVYRFGDWPGTEDVFQLCARYLNELRRIVADGQAKGYLS